MRSRIMAAALVVVLSACADGAGRFIGAGEQAPESSTTPTSSASAGDPDGAPSSVADPQRDGRQEVRPEPSVSDASSLHGSRAEGFVDPTCVRPGELVTLTVETTQPHAGVVYVATYRGGATGARPPYGDGYGGNNGGPAGADGTYTDAWVVHPNAPLGSASVDVTVIYGAHDSKERLSVPFRVGSRQGADAC